MASYETQSKEIKFPTYVNVNWQTAQDSGLIKWQPESLFGSFIPHQHTHTHLYRMLWSLEWCPPSRCCSSSSPGSRDPRLPHPPHRTTSPPWRQLQPQHTKLHINQGRQQYMHSILHSTVHENIATASHSGWILLWETRRVPVQIIGLTQNHCWLSRSASGCFTFTDPALEPQPLKVFE